MKYLLTLLAIMACLISPVYAHKEKHKYASVGSEVTVDEGCPLDPRTLESLGHIEDIPVACYGEFTEQPEYDVISFDCIAEPGSRPGGVTIQVPRARNILANQNSENINQVILTEGRACIGTIGLLLSERFCLLETPDPRFIFVRRVLVIDKIEPQVWYFTLSDLSLVFQNQGCS